MRQPLETGTALRFPDGSKYEILSLLGQGGSSLIYAAREETSLIPIALKELFPAEGFVRRRGEVVPEADTPAAAAEWASRKDALAREIPLSQRAFRNSFRILPLRGELHQTAELTLPDGTRYRKAKVCCVKMDSLQEKGMPLARYLEEYRALHGSLPLEQAVALLKTILEAYSPLHAAGYLHGDCQTGNLFLMDADPRAGKPGVAFLLDFGSARKVEADGQTADIVGGVYSTPGYRAPELLHHGPVFRLTPGCDVWPLGLLFLDFLTGILQKWGVQDRELLTDHLTLHPGDGQIKRGRAAALGLDEATLALTNRLLARALAEDTADRYPDAGAMLDDLLALEGCLTLDTARGVSREMLWEAACRYRRRSPSLFRTEHIPTLTDGLPVKKLTVYASLDGERSRPAVDLLRSLSRDEKLKDDDWDILFRLFGGAEGKKSDAVSSGGELLSDPTWKELEEQLNWGLDEVGTEPVKAQPVEPRRPDSRSVYLHAPGGSGKSFATAELMLELLKTGEQIPLYLDLIRVTPQALERAGGARALIPHLLADQYLDASRRAAEGIEALLSQVTGEYHFCLVLDNLHKVPAEVMDAAYAAICHAESAYANTWLVVVGRRAVPKKEPADGGRFLPLPHRMEIDLLPKDEMRTHAATVLKQRPLQLAEDDPLYRFEVRRKEGLPFWDADAILKQRDVVGRPLFFMRYLEILTRPTGGFDLPNGRAEILSLYFGRREYEANDRAVHEFLTWHMPWVAYRAMLTETAEYCREELDTWLQESCGRWGGREGLLDDFLQEAVDNLAILSPAGEDTFRFAHDCYQEYFAGVAIAQCVKRTLEEGDLRHMKKVDHRWAEKAEAMWLELCTQEMSGGQVRQINTKERMLDELYGLLERDPETGRNCAFHLPYNVLCVTASIGDEQKSSSYFQALRKESRPMGFPFGKGTTSENHRPKIEDKYLRWLKASAELGDPEMQYIYADILFHGMISDPKRDQEESMIWMERAAEQGYPLAQKHLIYQYFYGFAGKPHEDRAFYWLSRSAEQGDLESQYQLGRCYFEGDEVEQNRTLAVKWLLGPARSGENDYYVGKAQTIMAGLFLDALGHAGQLPPAMDELPAETLYGLGRAFDTGETVAEDHQTAMEYYARAAALGHPKAQHHLGLGCWNGTGGIREPLQAALWLARAVAQGHKEACAAFGACLEDENVRAVFENLA